jgi:hypothetical protein
MWSKKKRVNKYNNKKCQWRNMLFDSKKELKCAIWLESLKQKKEIKSYLREKPYLIFVNNIKICKIVPDFTVCMYDDSIKVIEIKSKPTMTSTWKIKMKLFKAIYSHIEYLVNPKSL